MSDDAEVSLMQWMTVEQLARFSDALQAYEDAEAEKQRLFQKVRDLGRESEPVKQVLSAGDFSLLMHATSRQASALKLRTEIIDVVGRKFPAFCKLQPMACVVMEELVNSGTTPDKCGGRQKFWALVYGEILLRYGKEIAADHDFKHVQILEYLTQVLPDHLDGCAEQARESGNPILAQVMEELAQPSEPES